MEDSTTPALDDVTDPDVARLTDELADHDAERDSWLAQLSGGRVLHYIINTEAARTPAHVAGIMRDGVQPPAMVVDEWLVRGELHWVYADAEAGKTWLALIWALEVMRDGGTVMWVDEEVGPAVIADRLLALGATPDEVEDRLIYLAFPGWDMSTVDGESWNDLLFATQPALTVVDTVTDSLANAELDENSGVDVTNWVKRFCEPAKQAGSTIVVLDHTAKSVSGGRHAVGSRAKRAKAKVQYALETKKSYNRTTIGRVDVTCTKNTLGATIPATRTFNVGGDGNGRFMWELLSAADITEDHVASSDADVKQRIIELLKTEDAPLTSNQINDRVRGKKSKVLDALKELAGDDFWPVQAASGPRNSTVYSYVEPPVPASTGSTPI